MKKNLLFLAIGSFLPLLSITAQTCNQKCGEIIYVKFFFETKDKSLWGLDYYYFNDTLYSGEMEKSILNSHCQLDSLCVFSDDYFVMKKTSDSVRVKQHFKTRYKEINDFFYWQCYKIEAKFTFSSCPIEFPDFLKFNYNHVYTTLLPISINLKSVKPTKMPKNLVKLFYKNIENIRYLEENDYWKFEEYISKNRK
jgi:hypothetical protein